METALDKIFKIALVANNVNNSMEEADLSFDEKVAVLSMVADWLGIEGETNGKDIKYIANMIYSE